MSGLPRELGRSIKHLSVSNGTAAESVTHQYPAEKAG